MRKGRTTFHWALSSDKECRVREAKVRGSALGQYGDKALTSQNKNPIKRCRLWARLWNPKFHTGCWSWRREIKLWSSHRTGRCGWTGTFRHFFLTWAALFSLRLLGPWLENAPLLQFPNICTHRVYFFFMCSLNPNNLTSAPSTLVNWLPRSSHS